MVNGYLISYLALNTLWVHIPILIIIVTTHIFSSEFELGTIKTLLTQPIERTELMVAKIVAMVCFVIIFMLVVALSALLPALVLFGFGDVIVFIDGIQFIQQATYLGRYMLAIFFSIISMVAFSSMAMFFALYFRNTLSAILISIGILIMSTLIQTFIFGFFSDWQPFLFTYHFAKWQLFFVDTIPVKTIVNAVIFLLGMILFFVALSVMRFKKMQITE
jgi:ABC-2 type transport system permease protein